MYKPVDHPEKVCEYCGRVFKPNRSDKRYCRSSCQKDASARRQEGFVLKKRRQAQKRRLKNHPYRSFKKNFCECCGFVATHSCQLDVDHIDGVHHNNDPSNLQTLCANCHRLKTWMNKDWENKKAAED